MTQPKDLTPNVMKAIDARLSIYCPGCRVIREADLLALIVAGRGNQPIREMLFKCTACGDAGQPSADWFDGEKRRYDFYAGTLKSGGLPSTYK